MMSSKERCIDKCILFDMLLISKITWMFTFIKNVQSRIDKNFFPSKLEVENKEKKCERIMSCWYFLMMYIYKYSHL